MSNSTHSEPGKFSSYSGDHAASRENYSPKIQGLAVRTYPEGLQPERMIILPHQSYDVPNQHDRILSIRSDTFIDMDGHFAELAADTRFVLNALLAKRYRSLPALDIVNFESGFRGTHHDSESVKRSSLSTYLSRAINALNAWSIQASDDILVDRTNWGSGTPRPEYYIADDIRVYDERSE